jgi:hypothetical protein
MAEEEEGGRTFLSAFGSNSFQVISTVSIALLNGLEYSISGKGIPASISLFHAFTV